MLVSVIIPVYQVESYLNDCLTSVVCQTYRDLDIILVDDGSTDQSSQICDNWAEKDARIRVFHQENQGLSGARNTGLAMAKGEYVFFLDSDDEMLPDCIEKYMEPLKSGDYDVIQANFLVEPKGALPLLSKVRNNSSVIGADVAKELLYSNFYMTAANKLYRNSFLEKYHLSFIKGIIQEDVLWTFELACMAPSLYLMNDELYVYKLREGSISSAMDAIKKTSNMVFLAQKMTEFLKENNKWENRFALLYVREWLYLTLYNVFIKCRGIHAMGEYVQLREIASQVLSKNRLGIFRGGLVRFLKDVHWCIPRTCGFVYISTFLRLKYMSLRTNE